MYDHSDHCSNAWDDTKTCSPRFEHHGYDAHVNRHPNGTSKRTRCNHVILCMTPLRFRTIRHINILETESILIVYIIQGVFYNSIHDF